MVNFLVQDICTQRNILEFNEGHQLYKQYLIPFSNCLAPATPNDELRETTLFQVVDIRDISRSILSLIEELSIYIDVNNAYFDRQRSGADASKQNGKNSKPRVAINSVEQSDEIYSSGAKTYRLTLQDCYGNTCYAYEKSNLDFLRRSGDLYPIKLGYKLLIFKGTKIIFNTLQLENKNIKSLGGGIDRLNYKLHQRKLEELKQELNYEG